MNSNTKRFIAQSVAAVAIAAVLLVVLAPANLRIAAGVFMWIALALSWNIIGGYTGYLSFGHAAFFGIGAYTTAILVNTAGMPFSVAVIIGGIHATIVAALIGIPTLRLNGAYFAIGTWAVALFCMQLTKVLDITGGAFGLGMAPPFSDQVFYLIMFALAYAAFFVTWRFIEHGRLGRRLQAIRENETAAEMLGINTTREKLVAFSLSAIFPGVLGGVFAGWIAFIDPGAVFGEQINDPMVLMAILGGLGTLFGPVAAAVLLYLFNRILWINWGADTIYLVLLGALTCAVVIYAPDGIVGTARRLLGRGRQNSGQNW